VQGTIVFVVSQGAVRLGALALRNFQLVAEIDGGDAKELVIAFDAAFDIGFQVICCGDSARFQRAGKCAGQSTSERRDNVVDGGGKRRGVFHAVIFGVATVHAKMSGSENPSMCASRKGLFFWTRRIFAV
jgi:hypothetical protein